MATILSFDATRTPSIRRTSPLGRGLYQHPSVKRAAFLAEEYAYHADELRGLTDLERDFIEGDPYIAREVWMRREAVRSFIAEQHCARETRFMTPFDKAAEEYKIGSPWSPGDLGLIAYELPFLPEHEQILAFAMERVPRVYAIKAIETNAASELERGCIIAFYQTEWRLRVPKRVWRKSWRRRRWN